MELSSLKIRVAMANAIMNTAALAEKSGLPSQTINRVLRQGRTTPVTAGKIAAGLGVPVEALIATVPGAV